jgi:xanthine dehydrogenase accessory factor
MEVWKNILNKLEENQKVMLLLVVSHLGSSPGKQGFKMLVSADDYLYGSIGGGRTEFQLVETAKELLKKEVINPFFQNQIHRDDETDSSGMICAGEQLVLFYPMNKSHIPTIKSIIKKDKGVLTISDSTFNLDVDTSQKNDFSFIQTATDAWEYKEKVNRKSYIYLVGGGHVGLATAKLFEMLDFEVTMFDDRKNLNTFEENTYSAHKKIIDYQNIAKHIRTGENTYIVILTHGYHADRLIFSKLLPNNYKYIGLLGSKAKIKAMFKTMITDGCDQEQLEKADAPIGIDINSKTPAEIAVSIAAKIISIRNL